MAGKQRGFRWTSDNLSTNLRGASARVEAAVWAATQYQAKRSESYMRTNARWTDQTSNARNGLQAIPERPGKGSYRITLTHSVPYGIWLEVRWSGKYGIIPESVRQGGNELMTLLSMVFKAVQA